RRSCLRSPIEERIRDWKIVLALLEQLVPDVELLVAPDAIIGVGERHIERPAKGRVSQTGPPSERVAGIDIIFPGQQIIDLAAIPLALQRQIEERRLRNENAGCGSLSARTQIGNGP